MKVLSKEIIERVLELSLLVMMINILGHLKMVKFMVLVLTHIKMDNLFKVNGIWVNFKNEISIIIIIYNINIKMFLGKAGVMALYAKRKFD